MNEGMQIVAAGNAGLTLAIGVVVGGVVLVGALAFAAYHAITTRNSNRQVG